MVAGVQIRGPQGDITLDVTTRITRTTGPANYTTVANRSGSVLIPDVGDGTPFFALLTTFYYPFNSFVAKRLPQFTLNYQTNVLSWTAAEGAVDFIVGAY